MREIAEVLSLDTGLAVAIVQMANAPYFLRLKKAQSIYEACIHLGRGHLRNLLATVGVVQSFRDHKHPEHFRQLWIHS